MKRFGLFLFSLISFSAIAQIVNPVHWSWKAEPQKTGEYKLIITADLDKGWHTYSQYQGDEGAVPTTFTFEKNPNVTLVGKTTETSPKIHEGIDDAFGVFQKSFEEKAIFTQVVKVKANTTFKGSVEYLVCATSCLPPTTVEFSFELTSSASANPEKTAKNAEISKSGTDTLAEELEKSGFGKAPCIPTDSELTSQQPTTKNAQLSPYYQHFFNKEKLGTVSANCTPEEEEITTWLAFLLGFGGGLLALFTPCVFPMIPLTVSFFTKRNENKTKGKFESIFYGFSIMTIFLLLSLPFLLFNLSPNTLNAIATNIWVNLFFFIIFLIFAFSFFGYYEITLPSSFANKVDNASNIGGLVGIFLMALTLVIVSFSCTGPILGTLLGSMATAPNGKLNLVVGMTAFGLAMGLPFTLFAFFPNLLKKLPKSGSWMDSLKVVLGFVELILALKFLSNADLVGHWGILKRELFLALWAILGVAIVLYLVGVLKMKGNENVNKKSPVRLFFAAFFAVFSAYCVYGLAGNHLVHFSGFLPPNYYSFVEKKTDCPNDLNCFHDYDEGLAYAKAHNKPILLDFTGYNCANCRRMEETVWIEPNVYKTINENYVLISLYVDDYEHKLPDSMQYISPFTGTKRTSYGDKWSDFQAICFNTNTQPQYVLLSPDEKQLNAPWKGYDADAEKYLEFLSCGLNEMKN